MLCTTHIGYASSAKLHCSAVFFQQTVTSDFGNSSTLVKLENLHYMKKNMTVSGLNYFLEATSGFCCI